MLAASLPEPISNMFFSRQCFIWCCFKLRSKIKDLTDCVSWNSASLSLWISLFLSVQNSLVVLLRTRYPVLYAEIPCVILCSLPKTLCLIPGVAELQWWAKCSLSTVNNQVVNSIRCLEIFAQRIQHRVSPWQEHWGLWMMGKVRSPGMLTI